MSKQPKAFPNVERLSVSLDVEAGILDVGTLVWSRDERRAYFEYGVEFLDAHLPLSPLNLPVSAGLKPAPYSPFDGLHGLFNDSLPDGWGRLLLDRRLAKENYNHQALSPLDRLAYVGHSGMGALRYLPKKTFDSSTDTEISLDSLAEQAEHAQREFNTADIDQLLQIQGGSAGARPKIMIGLDPLNDKIVPDPGNGVPAAYEPWIVKFRSIHDPDEVGAEEYAYSLMAAAAGVDMPPTRLIETKKARYFAVRRFDRSGQTRVHVQTASALLDVDHRTPQIEYEGLLNLTRVLTRDERDVRQMFRRMTFNVLAHNRDDHAKNHAFMMASDGTWHPTPAYDLTLSEGPAGEHSLAISGEGRNPGREHIMRVAKAETIPAADAVAIFEEVEAIVSRWREFATAASLSKQRTSAIDDILNRRGSSRKG